MHSDVLDIEKKRIKQELTKIEQQIDKVEEAILKYARSEGVEVIKGSDCKAVVKFGQELKFPHKHDVERQELDRVIKQAGKWEDVSELDTTALSRVVRGDLWNRALIADVLKYGRLEPKSTVRVSKLKEWEQ